MNAVLGMFHLLYSLFEFSYTAKRIRTNFVKNCAVNGIYDPMDI